MSLPSPCPRCGKPIPKDAPFGMCGCELLAEAIQPNPAETASPAQSPDASNESPRSVGPYHFIRKLGEGGFGVVYLARQERPVRREVALKILKPGIDSTQVTARFQSERQTLARLDHPNVAKIYDAGTSKEGLPYFAMERVEGTDLKTFCKTHSLNVDQRLKLFLSICRGVHHAHQKGIVHRDLKPGNLLVQMESGVPLPKVIDFGIAKALNVDAQAKTLALTHSLQVIGTLAYMSPEQAAGSPDIDIRSDLYSLGTVLYELLSGTAPFGRRQLRDRPYDEVLRILREVNPPPPSARAAKRRSRGQSVPPTEGQGIERLLRGDLDAIVARAMEKRPEDRYQTTQALIDDIEHHLHNEPVEAANPSRLVRTRKFLRKHRPLVAAGATVALTLILSFSVSAHLLFGAVTARDREATVIRVTLEEIARRKAAQTNLDHLLAGSFNELYTALERSGDADLLQGLALRAWQHYGSHSKPEEPEQAGQRGRLFHRLAQVFLANDDPALAEKILDQAIALHRHHPPKVIEAQEALSLAQSLVARGHLRSGEGASTDLTEAINLMAPMASRDPSTETQSLLAEALQALGWHQAREGKGVAAIETLRKAERLVRALDRPLWLGKIRMEQVALLQDIMEVEQAGQLLSLAIANLDQLPANDERDLALADAHRVAAELAQPHHPQDARQHYHQALRILRATSSPSLEGLQTRAEILEILTDSESDREKMIQHQLSALQVYISIRHRSAFGSAWTPQVIETHLGLGNLKADQGQPFREHWEASESLLEEIELMDGGTPLDDLKRRLAWLKSRWSHLQDSPQS